MDGPHDGPSADLFCRWVDGEPFASGEDCFEVAEVLELAEGSGGLGGAVEKYEIWVLELNLVAVGADFSSHHDAGVLFEHAHGVVGAEECCCEGVGSVVDVGAVDGPVGVFTVGDALGGGDFADDAECVALVDGCEVSCGAVVEVSAWVVLEEFAAGVVAKVFAHCFGLFEGDNEVEGPGVDVSEHCLFDSNLGDRAEAVCGEDDDVDVELVLERCEVFGVECCGVEEDGNLFSSWFEEALAGLFDGG